ncbi:NAD(+) kinase [Anthocerotibacter panamensis]|uniref:NAD(+) kinase n=1 Tax=Anthocerotibacter panamensis TaxID=2857077 RepID=UPI001C401467|nr:NAD(+) kinase [Anthocerotibacter panamensis]
MGWEKVVIAYRADQPESSRMAEIWAQRLRAEGCQVLTGSTGPEHNPYPEFIQTWGETINLALILGGDGSTLAAARYLAPLGVPLLAVNVGGHLGFLTQNPAVLQADLLQRLSKGDFLNQERAMLQAVVEGQPTIRSLCLNEFILKPDNVNRLPMTVVNLEVDEESVDCYRGDGLIIATPTGSTSYSVAANGPILGLELRGISITPICPVSLSSRPIVLADNHRITVSASQPVDIPVRLWTDGVPVCALALHQRVYIQMAPLAARFLVLEREPSYFRTLREKLHWGSPTCDL